MIFNLPDYHVIDAVDLPLGRRRVVERADTIAEGCPDCGVISELVHAWSRQRVKDLPHAGSVEVVVVKPRLVCAEALCPRRTFTQTTAEVPLRARCTTRLRRGVVAAVIDHGRPVAGVAAGFGVAWWTVQHTLNQAVATLPDIDAGHVRHLGIDERRYRRVRWFRYPHTHGWRRVEPRMTTLVNADSGQVLGIVDGRDSARPGLAERPQPGVARPHPDCRDGPSATFRKAVTTSLPLAKISVDPFHLVQLANLCLTRVRQRLIQQRSRVGDGRPNPAWAHRTLLLRGHDTLTPRARHRLEEVFTRDDPTGELRAAWGVKEGLRLVLAGTTLDAARAAKQRLAGWVRAADTEETSRLWDTLNVWWPAVEVHITSRVTNARTEAANTTIKHIKRTGRGYRNNPHYQSRILLTSAHRARQHR